MHLKHLMGAMLLALSGSLFAATLQEKEEQGGDLTAPELTATFLAEVKDCEAKMPGFSAQAAPLLARLKNSPKFKEVENSSDFRRPALQRETAELVPAHRRGVDIDNQCKRTLEGLQGQVKLART